MAGEECPTCGFPLSVEGMIALQRAKGKAACILLQVAIQLIQTVTRGVMYFSTTLCVCVLSGVDRVAVQDAISSCRRERDKALNDALCYCNLAERPLVEKREMKVSMEKRIETVRDFWRNQIFEGQSRSGRIVKAASKSAKEILFLVILAYRQDYCNLA